MLAQVSNTSLMFNMSRGEDKNVADGLSNNLSKFHIGEIPELCEQGDSIGRTQRYNGVCLRDQP